MNEAMMQFKMTMADVMTEITPIIQGIASFVAGLGKSKTAANALKLVLAGLAVKGIDICSNRYLSGILNDSIRTWYTVSNRSCSGNE